MSNKILKYIDTIVSMLMHHHQSTVNFQLDKKVKNHISNECESHIPKKQQQLTMQKTNIEQKKGE